MMVWLVSLADMLDSMQDAFDGLGGGTKSLLGIAALLAALHY